MSEWRLISEAPRDGTLFLACLKVGMWNRAQDTRTEYWETHIVWVDDETGEIDGDAYQGWSLEDYSHWMPLPPPPETER